MPNAMQGFAALLGRVLLCAIFLNSAYGKITNWDGTLSYMQARGMPMADVGLPVAVGAEILGGLALLIGLKTRFGAVLLIAFLIPATFYFHNFWTFPDPDQRGQMIHFMKNCAIIGGLLMILAFGAGPWSVDGRKRKRRRPL
jgi:putative oxidoreductase